MTGQSTSASSKIIWLFIAILGAIALGYVALNRGETINAMWILTASVCVFDWVSLLQSIHR